MAVRVDRGMRNYMTEDPAEVDITEMELDVALGKVKARKAVKVKARRSRLELARAMLKGSRARQEAARRTGQL